MIRSIQLLGERCSGTNYLQALIRRNVIDVEITNLFGSKHWFLKDHFPRCAANQSTDHECLRSLDETDDTLFLIIIRNPYDWLRSLLKNPYHAPRHHDLEFSDFIRKPWLSCAHQRLNPLWPDSADNYYLIESADNVLKLRATKLRHWINLKQRVSHLAFISYESLSKDPDSLAVIANQYALPLRGSCIEDEKRYCSAGAIHERAYVPRRRPAIHCEDLDFIRNQLDWSAENFLGYHPEDYSHDN